MVLFFTTRLEFGRNDMNIAWRRAAVKHAYGQSQVEPRQKEWVEFILRHHATGQVALVANSMYDVEYVEYFTGIRPVYIPSWCGDADYSYGQRPEWVGCQHPPGRRVISDDKKWTFVMAPSKQNAWFYGGYKNEIVDIMHPFYKPYLNGLRAFKRKYRVTNISETSTQLINGRYYTLPNLRHSLHEMRSHASENYAAYPGIVWLPYQTSVMTFFEFYRLNIPMFAPSLNLLASWDADFGFMDGRIYGNPNRYEDLIRKTTKAAVNNTIPNPNLDHTHPEAAKYWLQFCDFYVFPHITLFDNWTHLMELINEVNLTEIEIAMEQENKKQRVEILQSWDKVFAKLLPHRDRGSFDFSDRGSVEV